MQAHERTHEAIVSALRDAGCVFAEEEARLLIEAATTPSELPGTLRRSFDIIVANAPYVPTDEIGLLPAEARLFEPSVALDGGADGLDLQRGVIGAATEWLGERGCLLIETSARQADRTARLAVDGGLVPEIRACADFEATVVVARLPDDD